MRKGIRNIFLSAAIGFFSLMCFGVSDAAVSAPVVDTATSKPSALNQKPTASSNAAEIVPHRAYYIIKLAGTKNGSEVSDINGRMLFSWADDCHAWNIEQKMQLRFYYSEGETSDSDNDLISHEAKDGSSYNFHARRVSEGKDTPQTFRGYASLNVDTDGNGNGEAVYSGDSDKHMNLSNAVFPAHHTLQLLEHARKGEKFFAINVFDGADEKGFNEISSFISAPIEPKGVVEKAKSKSDTDENPLLKVKAWPIRMAFFAPNSETGSPEYEMDMVLLDNGVIKSMTIDYGDFSMNAELVDVKPISAPKCSTTPSIPPS